MPLFNTVASDDIITTTAQALQANGFSVSIVDDAEAAKQAVLDYIPAGAEVMTATSATLDAVGLRDELNTSGTYNAVMPKLAALMGDPSKKREQRKLGTAPDYVVGSVHALTQDGHALIASNTGSQLPAYAYGAGHVVWVVGAQKIVKDLDEAHQRLMEYVFPLEDARARKAYGTSTSANKILLYYKEPANRIHIVIVKQALGF